MAPATLPLFGRILAYCCNARAASPPSFATQSPPFRLYNSQLLDVTVKSDKPALLRAASSDLGDQGDVAASPLLMCVMLEDEDELVV